MSGYIPPLPFRTPAMLIKRTVKQIKGMAKESFTDSEQFFCTAKSYGGTEKVVNGLYVIEDTWQIDTWYNPNICKGDRIRFLDDDSEYEIYATPENINRAGQYMRFKVIRFGG